MLLPELVLKQPKNRHWNKRTDFLKTIVCILRHLQEVFGCHAFGTWESHFHRKEPIEFGVLKVRDPMTFRTLRKRKVSARGIEHADEQGDNPQGDGRKHFIADKHRR